MSSWLITLVLTLFAGLVTNSKLQKRSIHNDKLFKVIGPTVQSHEAHKFRHQVSLQSNCGHICGGSILTDRLILTAAHCVWMKDPKKLVVVAGTTDLEASNKQVVDVYSYIAHRGYTSNIPANDIALIILQESLDVSRLTLVVLPRLGQKFTGQMVKASGWGGQSQNLTYTIMKVVDIEVCAHDSSVCADPVIPNTQTTNGDSGGPLFLQDNTNEVTLVGVASAITEKEYIFADVASLIPWIEESVAEASYIVDIIKHNVNYLPRHQCT